MNITDKVMDALNKALNDSNNIFIRELLAEALSELDDKVLVNGWQPIETAPMDGRLFLVMLPRMGYLVIRSKYDKVHGYFVNELDNENSVSRPAFYHDGDLWCDIPPHSTRSIRKK